METTLSELSTTLCAHCERDIPTSNFNLHYAHCYRNLEKCSVCGEMVPKKHADEHYNETHSPVDCSLCSATIQREAWSIHKGETCPQRMITCEYCEFPLPAVDLLKHQEICGNRTEFCHKCKKYVRLREMINHEIQFHGNSNGSAESSRDGRISEREEGAQRHTRDSSRRRILFTIAVTGIAVLLGSVFMQRGADTDKQQ